LHTGHNTACPAAFLLRCVIRGFYAKLITNFCYCSRLLLGSFKSGSADLQLRHLSSRTKTAIRQHVGGLNLWSS
jgi:hypothetical protein